MNQNLEKEDDNLVNKEEPVELENSSLGNAKNHEPEEPKESSVKKASNKNEAKKKDNLNNQE